MKQLQSLSFPPLPPHKLLVFPHPINQFLVRMSTLPVLICTSCHPARGHPFRIVDFFYINFFSHQTRKIIQFDSIAPPYYYFVLPH